MKLFVVLVTALLLLSSRALQKGPWRIRRGETARLRTTSALSASLKPQLTKLISGEDLTSEETEEAWGNILRGESPAVVGALLTLLRAKGETAQEVAGMVRAMRTACNKVELSGKLLDIVGTGGDGADTINISTAASILCSAAGCKVAKAGNRSVSSQCGSADVLEALGIKIELQPDEVAKVVEKCGMGFMYAPVNHPAMKEVAPVRKDLGVRTAFNILGPMTNAAGAQHVVIGVFDGSLMELMANTLMEVGYIEHGVVIHGCGLDEISPMGPSSIIELRNTAPPGEPRVYDVKKYDFDPLDIGVPRCVVGDLKGGDRTHNAAELRKVLRGGDETDAKRDSVVLNAGMALYVYDLTSSIEDGVKLARDTLNAGKAVAKLEDWIIASNEV